MRPVNILLIDNKPFQIRSLKPALEEFGHKVAGVATNLEEALKALQTLKYDLILLDLNIEEEVLKIELSRIIQAAYHKPYLFVSSDIRKETINQNMDAVDNDNSHRPVNEAALFFALQNALENHNQAETSLLVPIAKKAQHLFFFVRHGSSYKKIEWADVICLSVEKNYTRIFTLKEKAGFLIRYSLQKTWEGIVPDSLKEDFIKINRSEMVHIRHIQEVKEGMIVTVLKSFDITKSFWAEIKEKLHLVS